MAEQILDQLNSSSLFDLSGLVAVITGGGTVSDFHFLSNGNVPTGSAAGHWVDDSHNSDFERGGFGLLDWPQAGRS